MCVSVSTAVCAGVLDAAHVMPHQAPLIPVTPSPGTPHSSHSLTTHTPYLHHEMLQLVVREESWLVF